MSIFKPAYITFIICAGFVEFRTDNGYTGSNPGGIRKSRKWAKETLGLKGKQIEVFKQTPQDPVECVSVKI